MFEGWKMVKKNLSKDEVVKMKKNFVVAKKFLFETKSFAGERIYWNNFSYNCSDTFPQGLKSINCRISLR